MAHIVTCKYCKEHFDRDKEEFVEVSPRRYAHKKCTEGITIIDSKTQEEKDYEELEKYIIKLFNKDYVNAQIKKQIRDYRKEYKYTYTGMLKSLQWWFELKSKPIDKKYGIAIIPYIYDDACKYYYSLWIASQSIGAQEKWTPKVVEIEIAPPQAYPNPTRTFKLLEDMEE